MALKYDLGLLKTEPQPGQFLKVGSDGKLTSVALSVEDVSKPPSGGKRVTNLYVNSEGKLIVEYDTTPVP